MIIPVLNEEASIGLVLADLPDDLVSRVIVVDNGSTDQTGQVASNAGAIVVKEPQRGYGAACLRGMAEARQYHPDLIVFLDGDYSDHPEDLSLLVKPILEDNYDMVIGSRMLGRREPGALPIQSLVGNYMVPRFIRLLYGHHYTDLGPFRAIRFPELLSLAMEDQTYGWTVEMQIKAIRLGLQITEVPVRYRRRIGQSKVSGTIKGTIFAGYKILWTVFRYARRSV